MSKSYGNLLVIGLLVIAAFTGWGIVNALREASQQAVAPSASVATQVQQFFNPTPTIYPNGATVVRQIQSLARLETAQYTLEKVIAAESGQGALGALFGDKLLFVAHGEVIAGVDLSKLQPNDVNVDADGRVTVILPAAEVFVSSLNNEKSYVYDRQTGLFTKGDINLESVARQAAEDQLRQGALEDGILNLAQSNANNVIDRLLRTLNFTDVYIVTATPTP
ncbi:MAG: DUF4230 domain-containing protein [Anaerolineales bacterium]|nr:DUF4230 domain-containing protein [Anaerolineales bacterium]